MKFLKNFQNHQVTKILIDESIPKETQKGQTLNDSKYLNTCVQSPSVLLQGRVFLYRYGIKDPKHIYNLIYLFPLIPTSILIPIINRLKFYSYTKTQLTHLGYISVVFYQLSLSVSLLNLQFVCIFTESTVFTVYCF